MSKKRGAVRTVHVDQGGLAVIIQVYGNARVIIHRAKSPTTQTQAPGRLNTSGAEGEASKGVGRQK